MNDVNWIRPPDPAGLPGCRAAPAPGRVRAVRGEVASVRSELAAKIEAVGSKIDAVESRLDSKIDAVESRLDSKINIVDSKINVVDSKIDLIKSEMLSGFTALGAALENAVLRGELSTTREIADLRIRVERLEKERGQLPQ